MEHMEEISREKWLEIIECLARRRPDEVEQEWTWLMQRLGLGSEYFLALHEVIQQGRWRASDNPAGYIKAAARREERRSLARASGNGNELTVTDMERGSAGSSAEDFLDYMEYRQDHQQPTREADGVWRSAPGWSASYDGPQKKNSAHARFSLPQPQNGKLFPGPLARYMNHPKLRHLQEEIGLSQLTPEGAREAPSHEITPHAPPPERLPDWPAWASAAGLSEWEKKVVEYTISGVSREHALSAQPDEPSRKALQAAWKKLARTGLHRLRHAVPQNREPADAADSED